MMIRSSSCNRLPRTALVMGWVFLHSGLALATGDINHVPIADAGVDQSVLLGDTVQLNGSANDLDGDLIVSWTWVLDSAPEGSLVTLLGSTLLDLVLTPDVPGRYVLSLVASDGTDASAPDTVTIDVAIAGGVIHIVEQIGVTFVPADITVQPGDTIIWNWSLGGHTVTSGTPCTPDGIFFDEVLDSANPQVSFIVPGDGTTLIRYFCTPHCIVDMVGTITVEGAGIPCPEIRRFRAKCANDGRILTRLILSTADHDGETVTISVDGVPFVTTINGRVVRLVVNGGSGSHTVSLDEPSGCRAPQEVVCP